MRRLLGCWLLALLLAPAAVAAAPLKVVLIGGPNSEGPGRHEYREGIAQIATWLRARPGLAVAAYPDGWPQDPRALQGAATVLLYHDGDARHPLLDPARRRAFEALMQRGVGLIALHQASTVPADGALDLRRWLGGERQGFFDRSTQTALLEPAAHPVTQGVLAYASRDEFYPTLRFAAVGVTPLLTSELNVQHRDGRALADDWPQRAVVAWAYRRPGGGRAVGYTGAHFPQALAQPMLQRLLVNAIEWTAGLGPDAAPEAAAAVEPSDDDVATFHRDAQRSGWHARETRLAPAVVAAPGFGPRWQSPPLHGDGDAPPRLYATPLYLERLTIAAGPYRGQRFAAVIAATSNADVYAVNAAPSGDVAPGRILWRARLAAPCRLQPAPLDGVATGILATPVIDRARGRLYVAACDERQRWQAYALDLASGLVLPGWPLRLDEPALNAANRNAGPAPVPPRRRFDFRVQRGALNLSADGSRLYVVFGETETGWLVSVDTRQARIAGAFAAAAMPHRGSGGIWGAGGPAIDAAGRIHVVTGTGFDGYAEQDHDWTQSLLQLADDGERGLRLVGSYTPFNHCLSAKHDVDLGSGGVALLPANAGGRRLLVIGGKQGNAYLLDADRLPGRLDRRPPCSGDAAGDGSLLPPGPQPQFGGSRGPLNVFGPYSEQDAALDLARARSVPAAMRDADGRLAVFMTGNTRAALGSPESVPPSLVRLQVVDESGAAPYLQLQQRQQTEALANPGSPVISSDGARNAIVWVLDENARRSAALAGGGAPAPVLYAFDAQTLQLLWRSAPGALHTSGKYNEPLIARGQVIVGTDRLQAFGPGALVEPAASAPTTATAADPATLWQQRCAVCHDHAQGNVPPRALIAGHPLPRIVDALTSGLMQPQAAGLSAVQIDALARWLAAQGKP
ncbi:MAG: ThuA domain-containing protein [Rubrivivax sp.]